jgi:hypothetical protein
LSTKLEPIIGEKFYTTKSLSPEINNFCPECLSTGSKKELYLYQKNNIFDSVFEYYQYIKCKDCNITTNNLVPIKTNRTYIDIFKFTINSDGFRSDEFTQVHNQKHILFVGCSNTFGMAMELKNTWAYRLYTKIKDDEPLSGYYNLGHIGSSITENISNIFLYCKKYTKPDVIFFLMPTVGREMSPSEDMSNTNNEEIFMNFRYKKQRVIDSYMMLEEYCTSNNIKLISKTWDADLGILSTDDTLKNFKTFYSMNLDHFANLVADYCESNKNDPLAMKAADGLHAGNGQMHAESEIFYNIYKELT